MERQKNKKSMKRKETSKNHRYLSLAYLWAKSKSQINVYQSETLTDAQITNIRYAG